MEAASVGIWRLAAPVAARESWRGPACCRNPGGTSGCGLLGARRPFGPSRVVFRGIDVLPAELAGERGSSGLKPGFSPHSCAKAMVRGENPFVGCSACELTKRQRTASVGFTCYLLFIK